MNILHLSDIHFGIENFKKGFFDNKQKILEQLIEVVSKLDISKRPQYIIVTGDVVWTGNKKEYVEAEQWFKKLLDSLGLSGRNISFCVGNHDIERKSSINIDETTFKNNELMENYYSYENMFMFEKQIYNYNEFCEELNVVPYTYPCQNRVKYSYSIGYKRLGECDIRLVAFNSSVLSQSEEVPDSEMILGRAQIIDLEHRGIIGDIEKGNEDIPYTIAIFHHDPKFLKATEQNEYNGKIASLNRLMEDVDLALCGHTETGGLPQRRKYNQRGMLVTSGAAYYEDNHNNAFSIIHVEKGCSPDFTFFRYEKDGWKEYTDNILVSIGKDKSLRLADAQINRDLVKNGTCIKNAKFNISIDNKSTDIEMKEMIIEINKNIVRFSNDSEVTRKLAVVCTYENGKTNFSISIPPERYGCVSAMLNREEFFWFIKSHYSQSSLTRYALMDENGNELIFGTENINWNGIEETELQSINMLQRVQCIERKLGVRFYLPEDFYEYDLGRLKVIEDILQRGYTDRYSTCVGMTMGIDSKQNLLKVRQYAKQNNRFQWYYSGKYKLKLWGCEINIGKVHLLSSVYKVVDKRKLNKKIRTFQEGDVRVVKFLPEKEEKWYMIFDNYFEGDGEEFKKAPLLPMPSNNIPFDMFEEINSSD